MMSHNLFKTVIFIACTAIPLAAFADNVVTDVGNGVANTAVDVGNAVEGAVKDTGKGIANVVDGKSSTSGSKTTTTAAPAITDATVTKNVRAKIQELKTSKKISTGTAIDVSTSKGVVTLSGKVGREHDIATLKDTVKAEPGVKDVTVNLTVTNKPEA